MGHEKMGLGIEREYVRVSFGNDIVRQLRCIPFLTVPASSPGHEKKKCKC